MEPSKRKRKALVSLPPAKPVRLPLAPMTRWHGMINGMGLRPLAAPTAREALGRSMTLAMSL